MEDLLFLKERKTGRQLKEEEHLLERRQWIYENEIQQREWIEQNQWKQIMQSIQRSLAQSLSTAGKM